MALTGPDGKILPDSAATVPEPGQIQIGGKVYDLKDDTYGQGVVNAKPKAPDPEPQDPTLRADLEADRRAAAARAQSQADDMSRGEIQPSPTAPKPTTQAMTGDTAGMEAAAPPVAPKTPVAQVPPGTQDLAPGEPSILATKPTTQAMTGDTAGMEAAAPPVAPKTPEQRIADQAEMTPQERQADNANLAAAVSGPKTPEQRNADQAEMTPQERQADNANRAAAVTPPKTEAQRDADQGEMTTAERQADNAKRAAMAQTPGKAARDQAAAQAAAKQSAEAPTPGEQQAEAARTQAAAKQSAEAPTPGEANHNQAVTQAAAKPAVVAETGSAHSTALTTQSFDKDNAIKTGEGNSVDQKKLLQVALATGGHSVNFGSKLHPAGIDGVVGDKTSDAFHHKIEAYNKEHGTKIDPSDMDIKHEGAKALIAEYQAKHGGKEMIGADGKLTKDGQAAVAADTRQLNKDATMQAMLRGHDAAITAMGHAVQGAAVAVSHDRQAIEHHNDKPTTTQTVDADAARAKTDKLMAGRGAGAHVVQGGTEVAEKPFAQPSPVAQTTTLAPRQGLG